MALIVLPKNMVNAGKMAAATIMDNIPTTNIPPFGMCNAPTNPAFIAATAAKLGVPTPVPCVPVTVAPWIPGGAPTVLIKNMPAISINATLMCTWLGVIKFIAPGQATVMVP